MYHVPYFLCLYCTLTRSYPHIYCTMYLLLVLVLYLYSFLSPYLLYHVPYFLYFYCTFTRSFPHIYCTMYLLLVLVLNLYSFLSTYLLYHVPTSSMFHYYTPSNPNITLGFKPLFFGIIYFVVTHIIIRWLNICKM